MTIVVNGSGTITGISQGGLNDNIITQSELANTGVAGNGPAFSAYLNGASQSVSSGVWTKVTLNAEEFDTNSNFDSVTNYRFTPTVAGYYQLNCTMGAGISGGALYVPSIYKNGSAYKQGNWGSNPNGGVTVGSALIYMNGSTDYLELYGYVSGTSSVITAGSSVTYFQGVLVRAA